MKNQDNEPLDQHPIRRHLRWGRVLLLLVVLAVILTSVFWATVWAYENIYKAPKVKPVGADEKITTDARLNSRINVLLLGIDDGDSEAAADEPKRTDAIMVASFDPVHGEVSLLSLPRDTKVILPGHRSFDKINSAYAYGGVMMAKQTVANLLRIPIHYYALLNWQGFIKVVNLLGGVDLYVEKDMKYKDPYANLNIDIKQGYQHLDGEKSGEYIRFRKDELGDIGRVQRQQKFLKAMIVQLFSLDNIQKIPQLLSTVKDYVETDMTIYTMLQAVRSFKILDDNRINSGMLYGDFDDSEGTSYWRTNRSLVEKSLREVGIPFMDSKEDAITDDPTVGAEAPRKYVPAAKSVPDSESVETKRTEEEKPKKTIKRNELSKTGSAKAGSSQKKN